MNKKSTIGLFCRRGFSIFTRFKAKMCRKPLLSLKASPWVYTHFNIIKLFLGRKIAYVKRNFNLAKSIARSYIHIYLNLSTRKIPHILYVYKFETSKLCSSTILWEILVVDLISLNSYNVQYAYVKNSRYNYSLKRLNHNIDRFCCLYYVIGKSFLFLV